MYVYLNSLCILLDLHAVYFY